MQDPHGKYQRGQDSRDVHGPVDTGNPERQHVRDYGCCGDERGYCQGSPCAPAHECGHEERDTSDGSQHTTQHADEAGTFLYQADRVDNGQDSGRRGDVQCGVIGI